MRSRRISLAAGWLTALVLFAGCGSPAVDATRPTAGFGPALPPETASSRPTVTEADQRGLRTISASEVLPARNTGDARYHVVQPGDTLSAIAARFGITAEQLAEANGFNQSLVLQPGQWLYLPEATN